MFIWIAKQGVHCVPQGSLCRIVGLTTTAAQGKSKEFHCRREEKGSTAGSQWNMGERALKTTTNSQPFNWHIDEDFQLTSTAAVTNKIDLIHRDGRPWCLGRYTLR